MQLPSYQSFPRKLRRPLAIAGISLIAITVLVVVFYFLAQPYVQSQLGPVEDRSSGRVTFKVPAKLVQDDTLISRLFGGSENSDTVERASVWSWRETEAKDTLDNLLFSMGYSYVVAQGSIPSDRASVIAQLKQSSQATVISRIQTITGCRDTPAVKLYDYSCVDDRENKLHGLVGFLLVDNSNELHLVMMLGRDGIWQNNQSRIATILNGIGVKRQ